MFDCRNNKKKWKKRERHKTGMQQGKIYLSPVQRSTSGFSWHATYTCFCWEAFRCRQNLLVSQTGH